MARYKRIDTSPKFLPVDLSRQLLPGTFEHALDHLLDHELDLSGLDERFRNDATGAPAYPPAILLRLILFAYSRGIVSSRAIEQACRENVVFIALCGDQPPHFTTLAAFIRELKDEIANVFTQVLFICDAQGLIGREMFAIDGVKLPSNASKQRSGTRAEFKREAAKIEAQVRKMLTRHRDNDVQMPEPDRAAKELVQIGRLQCEAAQVRQWLKAYPEDRSGSKGSIRKSNRTDNDSAKMATGKGVIQGYTGVAAVDGKCQIIVEAQAHGTGSEQELLVPVVEAMQDLIEKTSTVTADAGYHSEKNLEALAKLEVDALIADNGLRKRDARFAGQQEHKAKPDPLYDKTSGGKKTRLFGPKDFHHDEDTQTCICPAGEFLYQNGSEVVIRGYEAVKYTGAKRVCGPCPLRDQCLRHPERTKVRQVVFFTGRTRKAESHTERMKRRIDSEEGRKRYGRRFAIVEPVFANIRYNKGLDRFTLRGRQKVDTQWKLFCLVHNIEKLAHHGYAQ
ncbi:MAG: IS1182 family transposase [Betaproteobacteria bacterium]